MTDEKQIPASVLEKTAKSLMPELAHLSDFGFASDDYPEKAALRFAERALTSIDYCGLVEQRDRLRRALGRTVELFDSFPGVSADAQDFVEWMREVRPALAKADACLARTEQPHD